MGDEPPSHQSAQFPPRTCPKCRGIVDILCDLCHGNRVVSRFVAAAWLSAHPEIHDTPADFPAVSPGSSQSVEKDNEGKDKG